MLVFSIDDVGGHLWRIPGASRAHHPVVRGLPLRQPCSDLTSILQQPERNHPLFRSCDTETRIVRGEL